MAFILGAVPAGLGFYELRADSPWMTTQCPTEFQSVATRQRIGRTL